MTDEFRDCFVGEQGYDALKKLMKNGNDFCTDVAKCLQDRADAEMIYVKALRKTEDTLKKLAGRTKGTLALAFTTLSTQTSKEGDAHSVIADALSNEISIPMRNLAETQIKERKSIEDILNGKFKEWNIQKKDDNKYRSRQFDKSREIESLANKINESSNSTKFNSKTKASSISTPLVMGCILPGGRHTSASEKSTSNSDVKHHTNLEISMKKAEEELEKTERKYHTSTKDVELLRQACDIEMQRSCDQLQTMEFNRINEIGNFIGIYMNSFKTFTDTMYQICNDLSSIKVLANNDIIVQARSNDRPAEIEILLYDIYAENQDNVMHDLRRIPSLMNWIAMLKKDIEIQQQTKNKSSSSLSSVSRPQKFNEDESLPDDDRDSSSDGAMCSTSSLSKKGIVQSRVQHRDGSSSSSNNDDDDGSMHRSKRENKKTEGIHGFSSEIFIDRHGAAVLEQLYRASLYKIESVYNRIKHEPEPTYEYKQLITRTFTEDGCPTTFLRLPAQSLTQTPPSAPPAAPYFIQAMPMYVAPSNMQQYQLMAQSVQGQAPPMNYTVNETRSTSDNRPVPTLGAMFMVQPPVNQPPAKHVRAIYAYQAEHDDELNLEPGDNILLLESRKDGWCKGNLYGKTGFFPGNYVE